MYYQLSYDFTFHEGGAGCDISIAGAGWCGTRWGSGGKETREEAALKG